MKRECPICNPARNPDQRLPTLSESDIAAIQRIVERNNKRVERLVRKRGPHAKQ